jgi:hypothetical protein
MWKEVRVTQVTSHLTLNMEAAWPSETSATQFTSTRCNYAAEQISTDTESIRWSLVLDNRQSHSYSRISEHFMEPRRFIFVFTRPPPQLVPVLSQMNPVHTTPSYFSNIHFNIYPPTYVYVFLVVSFLLSFPLKPCMHSASPPCELNALPTSSSLTRRL